MPGRFIKYTIPISIGIGSFWFVKLYDSKKISSDYLHLLGHCQLNQLDQSKPIQKIN